MYITQAQVERINKRIYKKRCLKMPKHVEQVWLPEEHLKKDKPKD